MSGPRFKLGQRVYFVLGGDDSAGIVTGLVQRTDHYDYLVVWTDRQEETCCALELSDEPVKDFAD